VDWATTGPQKEEVTLVCSSGPGRSKVGNSSVATHTRECASVCLRGGAEEAAPLARRGGQHYMQPSRVPSPHLLLELVHPGKALQAPQQQVATRETGLSSSSFLPRRKI
jgi:hypothetical protein